jgi:hypothetical protein
VNFSKTCPCFIPALLEISRIYVLVPNPTSKVGRGYLSKTQVPLLEYNLAMVFFLGLRLE